MSVARCQDLLNRPSREQEFAGPRPPLEEASGSLEQRLSQAMVGMLNNDALLVAWLSGLPPVRRMTARLVMIRQLGRERGAELFTRAFGPVSGPYAEAMARGRRQVLAALGRAGTPSEVQQGAPLLRAPLLRAAERRGAMIYRRETEGSEREADPEHPMVKEALARAGRGDPLPEGVRKEMEARFGVSFERVSVHTDRVAAEAARAVHAMAFTVGEDIFFAEGAFAPGGVSGRELLAHELTHVVQGWQGRISTATGTRQLSQRGDPLELEAEAMGAAPRSEVSPAQGPLPVLALASAPAPLLLRQTAPQPPALLDKDAATEALAYNKKRKLPAEAWAQIATLVGASGSLDADMVAKVAAFQSKKALATHGKVDDITLQWLSQEPKADSLARYIQNRDIVYLGANPDSRQKESSALANATSDHVTAITGTDQAHADQIDVGGGKGKKEWADLNTDAGIKRFLDTLPGLSVAKAKKLTKFLKSQSSSRDELAMLIRVLHRAETGQMIMKRMVLSGHSAGGSISGGDEMIVFSALAELTPLFPIATGQVEDLMVSACNTGQEEKMQQYVQIFPKLQTIWAYSGYSPDAAGGSIGHILRWEQGSHGPGRTDLAPGAAALAKQGGTSKNVALWTRDGGYQKAKSAEGFETTKKQVADLQPAYDSAYEDGAIDKAKLDQLQTALQNLTGNFQQQLSWVEKPLYEEMNKRTLLLRHWLGVTRGFMKKYGAEVRAGYLEAKVDNVEYKGLARAAALTKIREFRTTAKGKGEKAQRAAQLLSEILDKLDLDQIPEAWINA